MSKVGREVELKFPISGPEDVRAALVRLGAACDGAVFERNVLFDDAAGRFKRNGELLRLRQARRATLTYKRPIADRRYKVREEVEIEVSDFETAQRLLECLGFKRQLVYEKERETWRWGDAEIELDRLPFGWFVEIEAPPDVLAAAARALGFEPAEGLTADYVALHEAYCQERGIPAGDIVF